MKLEEAGDKQIGDTEWLLNTVKQNGRSEFVLKYVNKKLKRYFDISSNDIHIEKKINSNLEITGINSPTTPDFIIPKHNIIGDIKAGIKFEITYPLTCAGYAIAYENEYEVDINWGVIYFIPIHTNSKYSRVITYPQVHFFPIDNRLRQWFLDIRDEAYQTIAQKQPPKFPSDMNYCPRCKYKEYCISKGLELE